MVSSDDDMRPDALIETSLESLTSDEICRGKLFRKDESGYVHRSFDLLTAFTRLMNQLHKEGFVRWSRKSHLLLR